MQTFYPKYKFIINSWSKTIYFFLSSKPEIIEISDRWAVIISLRLLVVTCHIFRAFKIFFKIQNVSVVNVAMLKSLRSNQGVTVNNEQCKCCRFLFKWDWSDHELYILWSCDLLYCDYFKYTKGPFGCKITGMIDFWVKVPYVGGNVCQQREITMMCCTFISFLRARHLLTMYKKIGNILFCGMCHSMWCIITYFTILARNFITLSLLLCNCYIWIKSN